MIIFYYLIDHGWTMVRIDHDRTMIRIDHDRTMIRTIVKVQNEINLIFLSIRIFMF